MSNEKPFNYIDDTGQHRWNCLCFTPVIHANSNYFGKLLWCVYEYDIRSQHANSILAKFM